MYSALRKYLLKNANQNNPDSISNMQRQKRFNVFVEFSKQFNSPVKIIDIGGSDYYWKNLLEKMPGGLKVTILNVEKQKPEAGFEYICHDARNLDFIRDKEYDIVYSNSMIEHLEDFDSQKNLAGEIMRIGKKYFVQTPNFYFPVEPHFLFPFFQFLPENIKVKLAMKHNLGWYQKQSNLQDAEKLVNSIRLLKKNELLALFPDGIILKEKYFMFTKSFIIHN